MLVIENFNAQKSTRSKNVLLDLIVASGDVRILVMVKLFLRILNKIGIPVKRNPSISVPIFKGKDSIMNCGCY